jgi:branched-chain amino acid transport system substrate-binding protein
MSRKIMRLGLRGLLVFLMILGMTISAYAAPEGNVIKMGVITALTGPAGIYGLSTKCSLNSFGQFFNDKGGITVNGKKYTVQFYYADDKNEVAGARAAAEKLLYSDKVDFIVGAFSRHMVRAWAGLVMKEKKIAVVGGPSVEPKTEWPYLFHVTATESSRSYALCKLMKEKFGCKSVFYIFNDNYDGQTSKAVAEKQEKIRDLEVKGYVYANPITKDFYPVLAPILKTKPDFIFVNLVPGASALIIKQARELGYKGKFANSIVMPGDLVKWQRISGVEASKGFVAIMGGDPSEHSAIGTENNKYYQKNCPAYKSTDASYTMQPHILLMAIEKTQSFDSDVLRKALQNEEFHSLLTAPLKASGQNTYGIKQHFDVPVPYSMVTGEGKTEYLGSILYITP